MALDIFLEIKNELLNTSLVDIGSGKELYLSIPTYDGAPQYADLPSVKIEFNRSTNGMLKLKSPVYIVVPPGTTINAMYISTSTMKDDNFNSVPKDTIRITGDDVVTHTVSGIHVVEEINIGIATE